MSLWLKLLLFCTRRTQRFSQRWNRLQFLLWEKPRHRAVRLGNNVTFNVPVRGGTGTLQVGDNTLLGFSLANRLGNGAIMLQTREPDAEITIGRGTAISNNTVLSAIKRICIGDNCRIGDNVAIFDADFHEIDPATRDRSPGEVLPVIIGDNVWIGSRAMVLKGAVIGDNAVIGAMSLVTKPVPANCIAAGVPAKVLRSIETIQKS